MSSESCEDNSSISSDQCSWCVSIKGKDKSKKSSMDEIPLLPKTASKIRKHHEQTRRKHKSFDIFGGSKGKKNNDIPRSKGSSKKSSIKINKENDEIIKSEDHFLPIYLVFSNHELFDTGDVEDMEDYARR